ncbi:MAG: sulfurtransferase TusA family protein [Candidatus Hodarchaeales archaeon]|jgi:TusA-related sulfurtransferase/rhodanese-related sulfurtransferase
MKISKPRMVLKFIKLFFYRIVKRRWYLPGTPEITVDELFDRININQTPLIIDTREKNEFDGLSKDRANGHIPNSMSVPIMQLAEKLEDLEEFKEKEIVTLCPGGGMSLVAVEIMEKAGFTDVKSLKGGIWKWHDKGYPIVKTEGINYNQDSKDGSTEAISEIVKEKKPLDEKSIGKIHHSVDARNLSCPGPILQSKKALKSLKIGQVLEILATDPGSKRDIPAWANATGQELLISEERDSKDFRYLVKRLK